ncbi:MAG: hypothetical protein ILO34_03690, partial [Kiritimatiellae bacterium]|nr:hypothetical protein [Kiritimatiellia bacterium]
AAIDEAELKEGSIVIGSISLDTAARKISLVVDADVETRVSAAFEAIYEIGDSGTAVVRCKVLKKNTLMDSEWAEIAEKSIIVGREPAEIEVDLGDGVDLSTGFFKVVLE